MNQKSNLKSVILSFVMCIALIGCVSIKPVAEQKMKDTEVNSKQEIAPAQQEEVSVISAKETPANLLSTQGGDVTNLKDQQVISDTTQVQAATATPLPNLSADTAVSSTGQSSSGDTPVTNDEAAVSSGASSLADSAPVASQELEAPVSNVPIANWLVYRNDMYGFEISYPPHYLNKDIIQDLDPNPLVQISFLDQQLANSDLAAFQPPNFSILIYDNSAQLPIEQWLKTYGPLSSGQGLSVEAYPLANSQSIRVVLPLLSAPNEFFYVAHGAYIIRLTPLGAEASQMLTTFHFIK